METQRAVAARHLSPAARLVTSLLVFLAVYAFQMLGLPQPVTGPVVNAALFAAALFIGPWHAAGIGALTPAVAFARGILPAPLGPMIPFIAAGNALMVLLFHAAASRGRLAPGVALGAAAKFALLAAAVNFAVDVPAPVAAMMQWPQLLTALGGGLPLCGALYAVRGRKRPA